MKGIVSSKFWIEVPVSKTGFMIETVQASGGKIIQHEFCHGDIQVQQEVQQKVQQRSKNQYKNSRSGTVSIEIEDILKQGDASRREIVAQIPHRKYYSVNNALTSLRRRGRIELYKGNGSTGQWHLVTGGSHG